MTTPSYSEVLATNAARRHTEMKNAEAEAEQARRQAQEAQAHADSAWERADAMHEADPDAKAFEFSEARMADAQAKSAQEYSQQKAAEAEEATRAYEQAKTESMAHNPAAEQPGGYTERADGAVTQEDVQADADAAKQREQGREEFHQDLNEQVAAAQKDFAESHDGQHALGVNVQPKQPEEKPEQPPAGEQQPTSSDDPNANAPVDGGKDGHSPATQTSGQEPPKEEKKPEEKPEEEAPKEEKPKEEAPKEEKPKEDKPKDDTAKCVDGGKDQDKANAEEDGHDKDAGKSTADRATAGGDPEFLEKPPAPALGEGEYPQHEGLTSAVTSYETAARAADAAQLNAGLGALKSGAVSMLSLIHI